MRTSGGVVPAGIWRIEGCETAETCDVAVRISTLGWKKILMIPMPYIEVLSVCSMSLTVVVRMRSNGAMMRLDISLGERPE